MKKITFRRCTVMAAVFAACLFAAGCKPNQPNPAPNPEPAPNPAPNPTPNPAPAPSLEVPMPDTPSVVPGGTIQQETIPNPDPSVETVNVKIEVRSIAIPLTSGLTHGVALSLPVHDSLKPAIVTVPVPKAIVDNDLKRSEKMQELLLLMLKTKGLGDCKLYKTGAQTAGANPPPLDPADASNFLRNGSGKVYVGEPRKTITVTALEDAGLKADGSRGVEFVKIAPVTSSVATNGAEPKRTMSAADIKAITDATLQFTVWNTDTLTERRNTVENTVKAFLNGKMGTGQYKLFDGAAPGGTALNFNSAGAANSLFGAGPAPIASALRTAYFAIKELTIPLLVTIKPIAGRVRSHGSPEAFCEPTNDLSGQYYTSHQADGTTAIKNTDAVNLIMGGIQKNLQNALEAKGATYADYVFFTKESPADAVGTGTSADITNISSLTNFEHGMTIYIGKKIN